MPLDMSAATAPPRKRAAVGSRSKAVATPPPAKTVTEVREEGLNGLAQLGQGLLLLTGQYAQAATVGMHWGPIAHEGAKLADGNEKIASGIDFFIRIGPYGAFLNVLMPFVLQTAANYRFIKAENAANMGVVPPQVLEAQMKTDIMRQQAEAMRAQQEAMQEAAKVEAEYVAFMQQQTNGTKPELAEIK